MNFRSKLAWALAGFVAIATGLFTYYVANQVSASVIAEVNATASEGLIALWIFTIGTALVAGAIVLLLVAYLAGRRSAHLEGTDSGL
ncbi:hypothetical protein [Arcanobacterium hippocoleae]|uniref:Membrane protein YqhA n=1 Tax=Arcanobacterium hippocoleae TaxID=149017 RepID=A0ABU1T3E8_9ACTO|nr:hypothetical protein [Arcanobacterium hippocoleae]MDR6939391.1 putative membrane protein YqhA [Arcanobacterium hippocoleae]